MARRTRDRHCRERPCADIDLFQAGYVLLIYQSLCLSMNGKREDHRLCDGLRSSRKRTKMRQRAASAFTHGFGDLRIFQVLGTIEY